MVPKRPAAVCAQLLIVDGPHAGMVHILGTAAATLGRDSAADIHLASDTGCSRVHCRITFSAPEFTLTDLDSSNGTWVNNQRLSGPVNLLDGDEFCIGASVIRCRIATAADLAPPTLQVTGQQLREIASGDVPQIPGYQMKSLIGRGATAEVFSGLRLSDGQKVAIKILKPEVQQSERAMAVFSREASISMKLQHPAIIRTLDFGVHDGHPYLVMEYVHAISVKQVLGRTSLNSRVRIVSGMGTRLLDALNHAHEQQIVHRDVKPGNVLPYLREKKLLVKLGDFGLAKNFSIAGLTDLSRDRELKGTLAFMPPEQIESGRFARPQVDIYAVGACLYHWITGKFPFEFQSIPEGLTKVRYENPLSIHEHLPEIPEQFVQIVNRAMSKDPAGRFETALSMLEALEPLTQRDWY